MILENKRYNILVVEGFAKDRLLKSYPHSVQRKIAIMTELKDRVSHTRDMD